MAHTLDEALLLAAARSACHGADPHETPLLSASVLQLAAGNCARSWDECCATLAARVERDAAEEEEALLKILRWWRPLALGAPHPPTWYVQARKAAVTAGGDADDALLAAAAVHMQTRWRARRARRQAGMRAVSLAEAAASEGGNQALRCKVLRVRAALLLDRSAGASARVLVACLKPAEAVTELQGMQRRLSLQLSALTLALCSPLNGVGAEQHVRSPRAQPEVLPPAPPRQGLSPRPLDRQAQTPSPLASAFDAGLRPDSAKRAAAAQVAAAAAAAEHAAAQERAAAAAEHAAAKERAAASERLGSGKEAVVAAVSASKVAAEAAEAARTSPSSRGRLGADAAHGGAALPSGGFDLRAALIARGATREARETERAELALAEAAFERRSILNSTPPPSSPWTRMSPSPAVPAAERPASQLPMSPISPIRSAAHEVADAAHAASRERATPKERALVASLARHSAEERAAIAERSMLSASSGDTADVVSTWWSTHFAAGDAVPFERMRAAAEQELGSLSSVDVQLLRLELSDERGKLTKLALRVTRAPRPLAAQLCPPLLTSLVARRPLCAQRLLSGSVDGSNGHESVPSALRSLLQAARAQLDRQVEVRMRQAASRSASGKLTGGAKNSSIAKNLSPAERRIRLEFQD